MAGATAPTGPDTGSEPAESVTVSWRSYSISSGRARARKIRTKPSRRVSDRIWSRLTSVSAKP